MNNRSGQSMIEYIILVAIVAIASIGITKILGNTITTKLTQITYSLQGKRAEAEKVKVPEVQQKHWKQRGLEDFYEAAD